MGSVIVTLLFISLLTMACHWMGAWEACETTWGRSPVVLIIFLSMEFSQRTCEIVILECRKTACVYRKNRSREEKHGRILMQWQTCHVAQGKSLSSFLLHTSGLLRKGKVKDYTSLNERQEVKRRDRHTIMEMKAAERDKSFSLGPQPSQSDHDLSQN